MIKTLIKAALIATVSTIAVGQADAASHDYFLKLDGVKGETTKSRQHVPVRITSPADKMRSGVSIAVGDVNGDGRSAIENGHARVRGGLNPADQVQAPQKPQQGLLVPAVQQVRGTR